MSNSDQAVTVAVKELVEIVQKGVEEGDRIAAAKVLIQEFSLYSGIDSQDVHVFTWDDPDLEGTH